MEEKRRKFLVYGSAAALALASLSASGADNGVSVVDTGGKANCTNFHFVTKPRVIVDCPADQIYDFCFTREVVDASGVLNGTMHYFSDPTHNDLSKVGWDPDQIVYYGIIKYETTDGDLITREVGIWDSKNKNYGGLGTVTEGTGRFANATGSIGGYGNTDGGGIASGTICLN